MTSRRHAPSCDPPANAGYRDTREREKTRRSHAIDRRNEPVETLDGVLADVPECLADLSLIAVDRLNIDVANTLKALSD